MRCIAIAACPDEMRPCFRGSLRHSSAQHCDDHHQQSDCCGLLAALIMIVMMLFNEIMLTLECARSIRIILRLWWIGLNVVSLTKRSMRSVKAWVKFDTAEFICGKWIKYRYSLDF